ncbi:MAG: CBS domain-containing protein [Candidatus Caenarcaniphilales bacterium]|jgi:CBS domain-containing protein|nr:CBS domain-containing protein [Candidatus Caenarcaniphilales bacterium]
MSSEYLDEEFQIMDEASSGDRDVIESGINIEDPIRTLNLAPVVSVNSGMSLKEVIRLLKDKNFGCVTIIDKNQNTIGIFTERDVLKKVIDTNVNLEKALVDDYMTPNPQTLSENDPIAFALNRMAAGSYRHIPITRNGQVRFMLSVKNIVEEIAFAYRKKVMNLPPNLQQEISEYGG